MNILTLKKIINPRDSIRQCAVALAAIAGFASSAWATQTINVKFGNSGTPTDAMDGKAFITNNYQQSPAPYTGTRWNDYFRTDNTGPTAITVTGLLDSDGNATGVGYTTNSTQNVNYFFGPRAMGDHSNVTLLNSGLYRVTASGSGNTMNTRLIVTGLDVAKTYNIYLACSSELNLNNRWGIGTLAAVPGTTKDILNTAATKTAQTWKPGDNWQVFYNVAPQADGKIYVWGYNLNSSGTNSGITLNGFQVVDATGWQNSDKSIYNFTVAGTPSNYPGVISDHGTGDTITVTMPSTTQPWYSLAPTFTLADGAWCSPASGAATDFSGGPVDYTVTAQDGSAKVYHVSIVLSPAKDILTFTAGTTPCGVSGNTVSLVVPYGTTVGTLTPTITTSPYSTVSPASGIPQDFSSPVSYTVTADNGTTKVYTMIVYHGAAPGTIDTLPPGLPTGAQYRLVFVTSTETYGWKSPSGAPQTIADYNNFATNTATAVSALSSLGTTWKAIVATYNPNVTATANTATDPVANSATSVPIYNLEGMCVATSYSDLWDGTIQNPINWTELGAGPAAQRGGEYTVWTGIYGATGAYGGDWSLVTPSGGYIYCGNATATNSTWATTLGTSDPNARKSDLQPIYAMSGILTVPDLTLCNITSFSFTGSISTTIDNDAKTVSVVVPFGTSLASLSPTIMVSPYATVSPNSGVAQDFSLGAVNYTVTGGDTLITKTYAVTVAEAPSPYCVMTGFSINGVAGTIDQNAQTVSLTLPYGVSLNSLTPAIGVSLGASVTPGSGINNDFSVPPVNYTVTSQDGNHSKIYGVTVNVTPASTACDMLTFAAGGYPVTISGNEIKVLVPYGTDVSALAPTYTMSQYATGSPDSGVSQNLTTPQTYTITAQDGSTHHAYTVTVIQKPAPGTLAPIPPGLTVGTQYRLVFLTSGTTGGNVRNNPAITDIAYFNTFGTTAANAVPALASLSTTWKAVVSTNSTTGVQTNATTNTLTRATDPSVPIYNLGGMRVASGNTALWANTLDNPINVTEFGGGPPADARVHTGTLNGGTGWYTDGCLANPNGGYVGWGYADSTTVKWIYDNRGPDVQRPIYVMSGILTVPVYAAPGAPTLGTITPGHGQLTVAYTAGADNGAPITNYEYSLNSGVWTSATSTANPLVITGLGNGVSYTVAIRAVNAGGGGLASATSDPVTTLLAVPTAPTITAITGGNGSLSVAFTAPSSDGDATITNYKYSTDNGGTYTAVSPASAASPILISGLTNGTTYQVKILAVTLNGDGAPSTAVSGTPFTTPNDNFVDAINLPGGGGIQSGTSNISATTEAGESGFLYGDPETQKTVWFKWTAPSNGSLTISTVGTKNFAGTDWDSVIYIYDGATLATLNQLAAVDDGIAETTTQAVTAGTTYHVRLAWGGGPSGNPATERDSSNLILTWSFVSTGTSYYSWALANGAGGSASEDANHNGVPNGVEYFMGGTQASPATLPALVDNHDGTWTWIIPYDPAAAATCAYSFEASPTLSPPWSAIESPDTVLDDTTNHRLILTLHGGPAKKFARLVVTPN